MKIKQNIDIDGVSVDYGKMPNGLVDGFEFGIVIWVQLSCDTQEQEDAIISRFIEVVEDSSEDHGSSWREVLRRTVHRDKYVHIALLNFRVRDSY